MLSLNNGNLCTYNKDLYPLTPGPGSGSFELPGLHGQPPLQSTLAPSHLARHSFM